MKKIGRNDPCSCGSGKKFKKCCETKMIGGRFLATRTVTKGIEQMQKVSKLTSFLPPPLPKFSETPSVLTFSVQKQPEKARIS